MVKQFTEKDLTPIQVVFWSTEQGNEPVRDWLKDMSKDDRVKIGHDLALLQYGWPVGMPLCKSLKGGLWELRSKVAAGRQVARIILTFYDGTLVLLHGFIKKTNKTPKDDLDLATKRKKTLE
jgi:phage-related protein